MDELGYYSMMVSAMHDDRYYNPTDIVKYKASPNTVPVNIRPLIEDMDKFFGADYYTKFPDVLIAEQQ
jgi:hypothetical protein